VSYKEHFRRTLRAAPARLHFAAHSHHPWPDVTEDAQRFAWVDAGERLDFKWEHIFGTVIPKAQGHVARILGLSDPKTVAFSPSTHDFVLRIFSCLERKPVRILTTDSEFHSFVRQAKRWEEAGLATVEMVKVEPFSTFGERFAERAASGDHDLIYVSQVFFNSGFVFEALPDAVAAAPPDTWFVVDGYHAFFALPVDLSALEDRIFYMSGAYKYAMSGEGACFLHCPPGWGARPVDTGWFAGFGSLYNRPGDQVEYGTDGSRFLGATLDPTGVYRFNAVADLWEREGVSVAMIHDHVRALQQQFLDRLDGIGARELHSGRLVPDRAHRERGHFLTFRGSAAGDLFERMRQHAIVTDWRLDRLRFGFGIYHDPEDVDELAGRLAGLLG
jgi:selenocysteine lyase/cysteine desulfurase